jgi:methylmalonyl-CoA mutase N-terminal domain/subunit
MKSIECGFMQNEIQDAAYAAQRAIEKNEQIVVGVNQFQTDEKITLERQKIDPAIEAEAHARLKKLRATRNQEKVNELRARLETAAKGSENVMPLFVECMENQVTLGEVCNTLRGIWGEYVAEGF